jgi:hypothetical protein
MVLFVMIVYSIVMVVVNGFVKVYDYIDYRIRVALFLTKSS